MDTVVCPLCGASIGAPKFSYFGGKVHLKNHTRKCATASIEERAYYKQRRQWPKAADLVAWRKASVAQGG